MTPQEAAFARAAVEHTQNQLAQAEAMVAGARADGMPEEHVAIHEAQVEALRAELEHWKTAEALAEGVDGGTGNGNVTEAQAGLAGADGGGI